MLSWMIEILMKNHLLSDNNYNTVNLQSPKFLQRMTNYVGLTFSVGDATPRFTIRIGETKYHI
jgi:hypothetical protein